MMNPEIQKFWEDSGYILSNVDQTITAIVTGYKYEPDALFHPIETIAFGNTYRINGNWYTEEEMLRIIRKMAIFMNLEIKKFWEHAGYVVNHTPWYYNSPLDMSEFFHGAPRGSHVYDVWDACKDGRHRTIAVIWKVKNVPNEYVFKGKRYTEEQMLKLIKLKAFA